MADRASILRQLALGIDLAVAAGCSVIMFLLARSMLTATHDKFELRAVLFLSAPGLVALGSVFFVAAIGHWRSYVWRWPVQWIAVGVAVVLAAAALVA